MALERRSRFGGAMGASFAVHAALAVIALLLARNTPLDRPSTIAAADYPAVVWIPRAGPGGGGGGGGSRTPGPPRRAMRPGADRHTVAVAPSPLPIPSERPDADRPLAIDAKPLASGAAVLSGSIAGAPDLESRGPGDGPGAGSGKRTGDGPGDGPGLGPGQDGGCCEGAFHPGNGVEPARVLREVKPNYTMEAVQARIQGEVWVECVILPDGTVGAARVIRSLDPGLDREALKAAKQWRFIPGTRNGKPVAVIATIGLAFRIH